MSGKHSPTTPGPSGGVEPSAIERLPVDLILAIIDAILDIYEKDIDLGYFEPEQVDGQKDDATFTRFDVWKDLVRLAATCKALYNTMTPVIYRKDVQLNYASALLLSVKNGNISAVVKSLDQGADVSQNDYTEVVTWEDNYAEYVEEQAYWWKIYWTHRERVRISITPLLWAVFYRDLEATKLLMERGAGVDEFMILPMDRWRLDKMNEQGNCGDRRFLCPSVHGVVHQLDSKLRHDSYGYSQPQIFNIPEDIAERLRNYLRNGGNTLYCALLGRAHTMGFSFDRGEKEPSAPIAKLLVEAGADMRTLESVGLHALHQVCGNYDLDMAAFFLERGADPNVRDHLGNTPLHYMAENQRRVGDDTPLLLVRLLRDRGADVNAVNKGGYTPLHYCRRYAWGDNVEAAIALFKAGARVFAGFATRLSQIRAQNYSWTSGDHIDEAIMLASKAEQFVGRAIMTSQDEVNEDLTRAQHVLLYRLWHDNLGTRYVATGDDGVDVETWTPHDWGVYWHAQHRLIYGP